MERALSNYRMLCAKKDALQSVKLVPTYDAMPHGNEVSRTTEGYALRTLPEQEEIVIKAVDDAISEILHHKDGEEIIQLITMVYFQKTHTVEGAGAKMFISRDTAWRKMSRFIQIVGKNMGYM